MNNLGGLMQLPQQQSDISYWGNLAQFGLFPNGRGGVGPSSGFGLSGQMEQRPQNAAVG
jgi:hypothetical protein